MSQADRGAVYNTIQTQLNDGYRVIMEVPFANGGHLDMPLAGNYAETGGANRLYFSVDGNQGHWGIELTADGRFVNPVGYETGDVYATQYGEPYGETYTAGSHITITNRQISANGFIESDPDSPQVTNYIWQGSSAQFNSLSTRRSDTLYIVK